MGIDRRPNIYDYWSMDTFIIRHGIMIYSLGIDSRFYIQLYYMSAHKIEFFLNILLQNFQDTFYPWKDLSLDEMVVKWKVRSKFEMTIPINRRSIT